ncbi:MAG: bifunctional (p)ppGpp synthetase/guanosine-3',5'-bis(diphosphate) 3'-pyrophosphohydrolase [Elusimicrobia bacterium]|nr:bifunctional (p)ppGpp synthetase/guanosine-3',5'-bis(diphosphate) 3'-pyrophosphohydrolase [Elusimicrobiota bacterium]
MPAVSRARRLRRLAVLDQKLLAKAFRFALAAHAGQKRKGTDLPYILHPLGVTAAVLHMGGDARMAAAALLHDVLEDTSASPAALRRAFPSRVARLVAAESDDTTLPWEERKRRTVARLRRAPREVLRLAFADKLDNIRAIARDHERFGEGVWRRFNRPRLLQQRYYRALEAVFRRRLTGPDRAWSREFSRLVSAAFRTG